MELIKELCVGCGPFNPIWKVGNLMIALLFGLALGNTPMGYLSVSQTVFCPAPAVVSKTCSRCSTDTFQALQEVNVVNVLNAAYLTAYNPKDDEIVFAFRGSDDVIDYALDALFPLVPIGKQWSGPARVHFGFLKQFHWVEKSIHENLLRLNVLHPNANIAFVGHSLGGVLAHLSAIYAVKEYGFDARRIIIQTSGQPRTGDAELVKLSRSCQFAHYSRLANVFDLIPHLPPVKLGYAHDGQQFQINLDKSISTTGFSRARPFKHKGTYHEKYLNVDFGPCAL